MDTYQKAWGSVRMSEKRCWICGRTVKEAAKELKDKSPNFNNSGAGTVEFYSEIAKSLNLTAEHTENAKAPESLSND